MKLLAVLALVSVAMAAPQRQAYRPSPNGEVQLLRYENDNIGLGNYKFVFEQTDGTRREEVGELKNQGREDESIVVKGTYSWISPNGVTYTVIYVADDNGFQPEVQQGPGACYPPNVVATCLGR